MDRQTPRRTIVAIGGGQIGRPGKPCETTEIDREIVALARKPRPRLLFIPTASLDSEEYIEAVNRQFGDRLGCAVDCLCLLGRPLSQPDIRKRILAADIIYVGGGDTPTMLRRWRRFGVDLALKEAWERGIVLSGVSAGAMCWFRYGLSGGKPGGRKATRVTGLGLVPALCCPHYDSGEGRRPDLERVMRRTSGVALALDNCCALHIAGDGYRVLRSTPTARAYRAFWRRGVFEELPITDAADPQPLADLLILRERGARQ